MISARATSTSAREKVERLVDSLQTMLDQINASDEPLAIGAKLTVLRTMVAPLRLLGTFTGEIGSSETTVAQSPFYRRVRVAVVEALRNHPQAARDVVAALERVERGGADLEAAAE